MNRNDDGVDATARYTKPPRSRRLATIGAGTRVWRRAHVRSGAVIGRDCNIGANVFVDKNVRIGDRVKIQNNVSIYEGVQLDDESCVGPAAVFTNDRNPRATGEWQLVPTRVEHGATVGANATVVCGVTLGEHSLVAAGAVVTRSVLPHQLVQGNPARPAPGWACRCGRIVSRDADRPTVLACSSCPHEAEHIPEVRGRRGAPARGGSPCHVPRVSHRWFPPRRTGPKPVAGAGLWRASVGTTTPPMSRRADVQSAMLMHYAPDPRTTRGGRPPEDHQIQRGRPILDIPQIEPDRVRPN